MTDSTADDLGFRAVVGSSAAIRDAVALASRLARSHIQNVLIDGETGSGKELFARGIHYAGEGQSGPFAAVNCAAIPENLLESELFGHERGAFTGANAQKRGLFELTAGGTLLLDEVNELPLPLQPKLLRVLEQRTVRRVGGTKEIPLDCRIVAASNKRLEDCVAEGAFREDLFYRLGVFRVTLPPLRERASDVAMLARHFLVATARAHGIPVKRLSDEALSLLRSHRWPGNVRELKNVIDRAVVLSDGDDILPDHIVLQRRFSVSGRSDDAPATAAERETSPIGPFELRLRGRGATLEEIERAAIEQTLELADGNQSEAARRLGISRQTLIRKLKRYEADSDSPELREAVG